MFVDGKFDVLSDWTSIKKSVRPSRSAVVELPQRAISVSEHAPFEFILAQIQPEICRVHVFHNGPCEPCGLEVNLAFIGYTGDLDVSPIGVHDVWATIFADGESAINQCLFCAWSHRIHHCIVPRSCVGLACIVNFTFEGAPAEIHFLPAIQHHIWCSRGDVLKLVQHGFIPEVQPRFLTNFALVKAVKGDYAASKVMPKAV